MPKSAYFEIPITERSSESLEPKLVPPEDAEALRALPRMIKGIRNVFRKEVCTVFSHGDRFRVHVNVKNNGIFSTDGSDIPALMHLTAKELIKNAAGPSLPIAQAVSSMAMVELLSHFSASSPKEHLAPTFIDGTGTHAVPVLSPQVFSEKTRQSPRSRSDTFLIAGVQYDSRKRCVAKFTHDLIDVTLTEDVHQALLEHSISVLQQQRIWFEGTIVQGEDKMWSSMPGGRIIYQSDIDAT